MRNTIVLLILLVATGCTAGEAAPEASASGAALEGEEAPKARDVFDGYVVPTNATELRAPQNTFRIAGWNSDSGWIKLQDLAPDGKEVKEGDVIGTFEFMGKRALPHVMDRIQQAEANAEQGGLDVSQNIEKMQTEEARLGLDARRATLETQKEGIVSARDLERIKIEEKQAQFEAGAQTKRLKAYRRAAVAREAYRDQMVARAKQDLARYKTYETRFVIKAPHDGVVRHAFHSRRRRKVQKGDGMPGGMHFASVARDNTLSLQFYIPEHRYDLTRKQKSFVVQSPTSSKSYPIEVERVEQFPQELGFLKQDDAMPGAREKMYVVHARFLEPPEGLSAGLEVKVRLP
ncbi:MAG: hypothetical protein VYE40_16725 [Myxococcota bacterium]|nr:hypothetical protein [Myxococcota bacterium]